MTTTTDTDAPLPLEYDTPDDVDEEAAKVLAVLDGAAGTLRALDRMLSEGDAPEELEQAHVETLETAFRAGKRLLEHEDYDAFLSDGVAALPDDLVDTLAADLAPLAGAYGIDLDLGEDESGGLADYLTVDISNWRGS